MEKFKILVELIKPQSADEIIRYIKQARELEPKLNILQFKIYLHGYFEGKESK